MPVGYDQTFVPYAQAALDAYDRAIGGGASDVTPDQAIVCCIASLMHYAMANCYDADDIMVRAKELFASEA